MGGDYRKYEQGFNESVGGYKERNKVFNSDVWWVFLIGEAKPKI